MEHSGRLPPHAGFLLVVGVGEDCLSIEKTQTVLPLVYVQIDFLSQRILPEPLSHFTQTPMRKFPRRAVAKRQVTQSAQAEKPSEWVGENQKISRSWVRNLRVSSWRKEDPTF